MHGRHFTFKSILSHAAVTIVAPSVTGTLVTKDKPYVVQGPWLQVLLSEDLAEKMADEFQVLNSPDQVRRDPCFLMIQLLRIYGLKLTFLYSFFFSFNFRKPSPGRNTSWL